MRKPSAVFLYPPGEVQSEQSLAGVVRIFSVEMNQTWFERFKEHKAIGEVSTGFEGGLLLWLMMRLYREAHETDAAANLAVEGLALELIAEASRVSARDARHGGPKPPAWLKEAREILHDQFSDNLSLTRVAEAVGVHPVYLASAFHKHYRVTVGTYLRQLRLNFACREVATSERPLAEVALAAGFSSQAHFCKVFKGLTGMTPTEYRASTRTKR